LAPPTRPDAAAIALALRQFICTDLLGRSSYALRDDEPLVTGGLVDSFSLARVGVFAEQAFDVQLADGDLTVEHMDTLRAMVETILKARG
jgi:acyl carrier protein